MRSVVRAAAALLAVLILVAGWGLWHTRDRNPGYTLDLDIHPDASAPPGPLRVGFGRQAITPDLSRAVWLAGFANGRRATAVHDDLSAIAAVIDDGEHRLGLVALDAIGLFHDQVIDIRRRVVASSSLDYLVVASTHNHSAPDLLGLWGPRTGFSGVDPEYRARVVESAARAVVAADAALAPAQLRLLELPVPVAGLVADSRDPQVFDSTLRVMHFARADGTTIGSIVNWADHPETPWADNTEITADFPGYLRDVLENGVTVGGQRVLAGVGGTHVYVNGAIGGLMTTNPQTRVADPFEQEAYQTPSHDKARAVGRRLGEAILTALRSEAPVPESTPRLSVVARTVALPLDNRLFRLASAAGTIDRGQPHWNELRSEVALVRLGDASIACVPGELYPEIANGGITHPEGADFDVNPQEVPPLRDLMPGRVKFLVGLANDEIGYIIPKSEWDDRAPWLYGSPERLYGEINSLGPETAPLVHRFLADIFSKGAKR